MLESKNYVDLVTKDDIPNIEKVNQKSLFNQFIRLRIY